MDLFNQRDKITIPVNCKLCLKEVVFEVSAEEYSTTSTFPIIKEDVHGDPRHKLIVSINKQLEIEDFEIDNEKEPKDSDIPEEIINTLLSNIGLEEEEVRLYFLTTGRDIISLGELAFLADKTKEECQRIAEKFVQKGLYKLIISETPHYAPLPPYAVILGKVKDLQNNIWKVRDNLILIKKLSSELNKNLESLEFSQEEEEQVEDIRQIMFNIKNEVLENIQINDVDTKVQIKEIPKDIGNLDSYTNEIIQSQIPVIKRQFNDINTKSIQIIQAQISELNDKIDAMQTIISDNLKKLRLGVLEQTICRSVEKIVLRTLEDIQGELNVQLSVNEMVFNDELNSFMDRFNQEFIENFKSTIAQTIKKLDNIDLDINFDQNTIIQNITEQFNKSLLEAEKKITKICSGNIKSLASIKGLLTNSVESQIEGTINEILDQLQVQEHMTKYFWEQAKRRASISMRNVWFIHSIESARAHIDEQLSRAKLRVLIVAPKIIDINLNVIRECSSRINIRIAAFSDPTIPEHVKILKELASMGNVDYRNRQLKNLWGINKDYEEVVLCVLSHKEFNGKEQIEIAGIGSIIDEHLKIFIPILEEAWMGSEKQQIQQIELIQEPIKQIEPSQKSSVSEPFSQEILSPEKASDIFERIKELRKKGREALEKGALKESHSFFNQVSSLIDDNFQ